MNLELMRALGGLGLFLIGMIWMTDGLQALAGKGLRHMLARFTGSPLKGALTGAAATGLLQSSSATTVTSVSFVSAGLLSFPQALGIILGANIGTTMTGWLAAILGFKLDLGQITLPLILFGALLHIFGSGKWAQLGRVLAGFALIFLGIAELKAGFSGLEGWITPDDFPADDWSGRLRLIFAGAALTLITQSSSAGVATSLALLGVGAINLPQGLALVIGMDIGTTGTAALATLQGSAAARRTGFSHVIYNLFTGAIAFSLLDLYVFIAGPQGIGLDAQIALVGFHTTFNIFGVAIILPFAGKFAQFMVWLIPEKQGRLTARLGSELLQNRHAATDAAFATVRAIMQAQMEFFIRHIQLKKRQPGGREVLRRLASALSELDHFMEAIPKSKNQDVKNLRLAEIFHAQDHVRRLYFRLLQESRFEALAQDTRLSRLSGLLVTAALRLRAETQAKDLVAWLHRLQRLFHRQQTRYRQVLLNAAAEGSLSAEDVGARLDSLRWMERISQHLWRIAHHMAAAQEQNGGF